ncbi:MAG: hypothetical protein JKY69_03285 [Flavobacteriaceae bacterium]|nr:hypothetical protein [Flavobacteriaceae bacterium]MBL4904720.1 hypothetical protein [Flavobacteriaceae bacterium]
MITEIEQKKLRVLFQGHYTEDVLKILNDLGIQNRNGHPHNAQYVRMIFQGIRKNADIEAAIWQLAAKRRVLLEQQEIQKIKILNCSP